MVLALGLVAPTTAHAYIDPGTGSILVQAILGGIAAGTTLAGVYFARIKALVKATFGRTPPQDH